MSEHPRSEESEAQQLLDNCDGDFQDALKHLDRVRSEILNTAHAVEGFEKYKELKEGEADE